MSERNINSASSRQDKLEYHPIEEVAMDMDNTDSETVNISSSLLSHANAKHAQLAETITKRPCFTWHFVEEAAIPGLEAFVFLPRVDID